MVPKTASIKQRSNFSYFQMKYVYISRMAICEGLALADICYPYMLSSHENIQGRTFIFYLFLVIYKKQEIWLGSAPQVNSKGSFHRRLI